MSLQNAQGGKLSQLLQHLGLGSLPGDRQKTHPLLTGNFAKGLLLLLAEPGQNLLVNGHGVQGN